MVSVDNIYNNFVNSYITQLVTGVLPNTRHRSQISQLSKELWGLKHGLSRNPYTIYLIHRRWRTLWRLREITK